MIPISEALQDQKLLGAALGPAESWFNWLACLKAAFGEPLNKDEKRVFRTAGGKRKRGRGRFKQFWAICGRRAGKTKQAAAIATYIATFIDHSSRLSPGEVGYVLCLSPTVSQARLCFRYCLAFLESSTILRQKILSVTQNEIRLVGNVVISVHPANFRSVRGRALLACVFDESAYWRDESSAQPDVETYRAVLPALAATDGMLIGISSPYRQLGLLYEKHRDCYGQNDPDVLVVQGSTEFFNPTIDPKLIEKARKDDPLAAASEWDAQFRSDLSQFLPDDAIDACIENSRPKELEPQEGLSYFAFADASAGRNDAYTLCIGYKDDEGKFIAALIRGRQPPFNPEEVTAEFAALAREYGCRTIHGDAYAGEWVTAAFRKCGVEYRRSKLNKSALYLESLPQFMRGNLRFPNDKKLIRELRLLQRKTSSGGRDSVDHPLSAHDDFANSLCGCLHIAMQEKRRARVALSAPKIFDAGPAYNEMSYYEGI